MKSITAFGTAHGGKPVLTSRTRFYARFAEAFKDGEKFAITVQKSTRNLRQNALYWVWCTLIAKEYGCSPEYIHAENKRLFNRITEPYADPKTGEIHEVEYAGSTSELSVDAFAEFMERVQRGWASQGVDLPSANDEEYTPASAN